MKGNTFVQNPAVIKTKTIESANVRVSSKSHLEMKDLMGNKSLE